MENLHIWAVGGGFQASRVVFFLSECTSVHGCIRESGWEWASWHQQLNVSGLEPVSMFAGKLMSQRGSISGEVLGVTVTRRGVSSGMISRQADKELQLKADWHFILLFIMSHFPGFITLANTQYINVSRPWQQVVLFSTLTHFLFYSFKVTTRCSVYSPSNITVLPPLAHTATSCLCVEKER